MVSDSTSLNAAELVQARVRAERHATSFPLVIVGLGLLVLARLDVGPTGGIWTTPVFGAAFLLLLYVAMWVRRLSTGLGSGRDGYGLVVVVAAVLVFVPMSQLLGPAFSLGLGLGILGWRGREPLLWVSGLVIAMISPLAALGTIDNHGDLLGPAPTAVVLLVAGVAMVTIGVDRFARERRPASVGDDV